MVRKKRQELSLEDRLDQAKLAMIYAREQLEAARLGSPELWADDGPLVTPDVVRAAEVAGVSPGDIAGSLEVYRRTRAVRGCTDHVARLTEALYTEMKND